jgi:hypothetical protein
MAAGKWCKGSGFKVPGFRVQGSGFNPTLAGEARSLIIKETLMEL